MSMIFGRWRNEYNNDKDEIIVRLPIPYTYLLYDVAVIRWITSCHKSRMTTRAITLSRVLCVIFLK